jgi:uncharacterized protein (DUF362 family)
MDKTINKLEKKKGWTRRKFLKYAAAGGAASAAGLLLGRNLKSKGKKEQVFIASADDYTANIVGILQNGLKELGIEEDRFKGKRVLIKPNLVEPHQGLGHINTHPLMVQATVELFLRMGAGEVVVAEGAGHRRDVHLILEESGLADVLYEDRIPFVDLNNAPVQRIPNAGTYMSLKELILPSVVMEADVLVSLAKMKTHHWAGATLSMKNMFGIMPGIIYGWPKNVLHYAGIHRSILDINTTVRPHLAIVDGITGMEGDGPIMGTPIQSNVLVMGRNSVAVDATCCRIMGIDPYKIPYLEHSESLLGPLAEFRIDQRGEPIKSVQTVFQLIDDIPAHQGIRL